MLKRLSRNALSLFIRPSIVAATVISGDVFCQTKGGTMVETRPRARGAPRGGCGRTKTWDFHRMHNFSARDCVFPLQGSRLARAYYPPVRVVQCNVQRALRERRYGGCIDTVLIQLLQVFPGCMYGLRWPRRDVRTGFVPS